MATDSLGRALNCSLVTKARRPGRDRWLGQNRLLATSLPVTCVLRLMCMNLSMCVSMLFWKRERRSSQGEGTCWMRSPIIGDQPKSIVTEATTNLGWVNPIPATEGQTKIGVDSDRRHGIIRTLNHYSELACTMSIVVRSHVSCESEVRDEPGRRTKLDNRSLRARQ